jgi:hypothetical protein
MAAQWITELLAWGRSLSPEMAFLFALPFIVAVAGLIADQFRHRARR